ncbi:MAG: penicillin-binding protein activator LpoB [Desulfosarcina sp.]|nr:penicillin-binding protein activator LpoB [Desulfosarcina sp.]MBC2741866.1 penicillin-binding protein activator LpoB [Desulfosarcina sp.]MBC2764779.1 penicillin-binding protein activator LpoB [Desulfosarcina sp.]
MLAVGLLVAGCASVKVDRMGVDETVDLSGRWNDTDSRLVSEEMISDVLSRPWIDRFRAGRGKDPVVIVGSVRNRSDEHINTRTFVKDLERALINSGEVEFVASSVEREEIREERKDQAAHASEATAKEEGEEAGADFMLQGAINTISDRIEGKEVKYYQVNLELIDIQSHRKVWIGEKKIKKLVKRSRFGF